eukprot:1445556-Prymnesium_polylepis.1
MQDAQILPDRGPGAQRSPATRHPCSLPAGHLLQPLEEARPRARGLELGIVALRTTVNPTVSPNATVLGDRPTPA